jgi:hypothetical protein
MDARRKAWDQVQADKKAREETAKALARQKEEKAAAAQRLAESKQREAAARELVKQQKAERQQREREGREQRERDRQERGGDRRGKKQRSDLHDVDAPWKVDAGDGLHDRQPYAGGHRVRVNRSMLMFRMEMSPIGHREIFQDPVPQKDAVPASASLHREIELFM